MRFKTSDTTHICYDNKMSKYLNLAIELSRRSFNAGKFPAGAVLVTKAGNVYESDPSLPYYHGECMVIDKAIKAEGSPLDGSTMYASMESCLMCSAKMYWAGVTKVIFVIPKSKVNDLYAYEDDKPMNDHIGSFHILLESTNDPRLLDEALITYTQWVNKVESN
jgi:tRNA(Arg) A34 adenosine deaminase TadA